MTPWEQYAKFLGVPQAEWDEAQAAAEAIQALSDPRSCARCGGTGIEPQGLPDTRTLIHPVTGEPLIPPACSACEGNGVNDGEWYDT